jgi:hypothetical protein
MGAMVMLHAVVSDVALVVLHPFYLTPTIKVSDHIAKNRDGQKAQNDKGHPKVNTREYLD